MIAALCLYKYHHNAADKVLEIKDSIILNRVVDSHLAFNKDGKYALVAGIRRKFNRF
ncbi:MAG: hypothetical protein IPO23_09500 [Flavobacterium sp.]|nr:hypothetical protein [Flavobacterium sp.]